MPFVYLTVRNMQVMWVQEGSVEKCIMNGEEENDGICSDFYRFLWQCCLRVKIQSGSWASFWLVPV